MRKLINVDKRHIEQFGNLKFHYYESHETQEGRVVNKCRNTWNCDCRVGYVTYELGSLGEKPPEEI